MREIKFRAWHKEMKYMSPVGTVCFGHWAEIYMPEQVPPEGEVEWQGGQAKFKYMFSILNELEIMQFTGIKDKNGKDIYEGDIVTLDNGSSYKFGNFEIFYNKSEFAIIRDDGSIDSIGNLCDKIVLGNIYENPELFRTKEAGV
jgi:uncharacterized phage protein (TIGR01671 family)